MHLRKISKSIVAVFLAIILILTAVPITSIQVSAATEAQLTIDSVSAVPGEIVELIATLENAPVVKSMAISNITYDTDKMTLTNAEWLCDAEIKNWNSTQARGVLTFGENTDANGPVLKMTFKISDTAEDSDITVSCSVIVKAMDENGDEVPVEATVIPGKVEIRNEIPGDMDSNEKVNSDDAVYLLYHTLFGKEEYPIKQSGDIDGNGKTNSDDAVYLLYHTLFGEEEYPLNGICKHTNMAAADAKAPTCTEEGNVAYWYCADCGKYFSDAEATNEIAYTDTVLSATGHTEVIDEARAPTCTQIGFTEGSHCSVCNKVLVAQVEIEKADHIPGAQATCTEDQICTVCGEVLKTSNGHIPGDAASCINPQTCSVCQTVLTEATGHNLNYIPENDPVDNNNPGNCAYWQCSVCGKCYLDEAATQEIALADTAYKTYLVYFFDLEKDTYTVKAYKQSEVLSLKNVFPDDLKGYDFNGWHTSENFTNENKISVVPAGNTETLNLYANRSLHEFKITLLGLGREKSETYNIVEGFTFATPKWKESAGEGDCLIFSHWSDENGNKITEISAGEIGDRTIKANWIYRENYAISNPDKYTYVSGMLDQYGRYSFIYEIGQIKNLVLSKQHTYTFNGLVEHAEAETKTYTVGSSEGQEAAKTISRIISNSTEMANIETNTSTHTEGWEVGAEWKPEIEFAGIKASAWGFSGGYSNTNTDLYEKTDFDSEKNYEENGTENEVRSIIDYYAEESVSRTVSDTFIPGVTPVGNYTWARLMDVKVYAIVTYNPYTGNYVFDVYSVPTNVHNGLLYTLPSNMEYEVNIVSGDVLDFAIPFDKMPEMFYTVEYDANGGTGSMPMSVHEMGMSFELLPNAFTRTGYTFDGWKTSKDGNTSIYTDGMIVSDIASGGETKKLYAHWIPNEYTITYNTNGGIITGDYTTKYTVEDSEIILPKLVHNQYPEYNYIVGWYYDAACSQPYISDYKINPKDVTLYAKWAYSFYNSIDTTPWFTTERVIIDWRNEADTNLLNHINREVVDKRYNNLNIYNTTSEIIFIGDPEKTYINFRMDICNFAENQKLKIQFVDFNFVTNEDTAIGLVDDSGVDLTIEVIGSCSMGTNYAGGNIIGRADGVIKSLIFTGSGMINVTAGNGADGVSSGAPGGDGGIAICAETLNVDMTGTLNVTGGNGGNGANGSTYSGQNGGNGGCAGNGGVAIDCKYFNVVKIDDITVTGGDGGNGGFGLGGKQGIIHNVSYEDGGNGGHGGDGGDGGHSVSGEIQIGDANTLNIIGGNGGDGGDGGNGGNGGNQDTYWFAQPSGFSGGNAGNGGNAGCGGNGFTVGKSGDFGIAGTKGKGTSGSYFTGFPLKGEDGAPGKDGDPGTVGSQLVIVE